MACLFIDSDSNAEEAFIFKFSMMISFFPGFIACFIFL